MHDVNMKEEKRQKQQHHQQEAYDEDEEPSSSRVQCTKFRLALIFNLQCFQLDSLPSPYVAYLWFVLSISGSLKFLKLKLCTVFIIDKKIRKCFISCTIPKFWLVIIIIIYSQLQLVCDQESGFWISSLQIMKCQLVLVMYVWK